MNDGLGTIRELFSIDYNNDNYGTNNNSDNSDSLGVIRPGLKSKTFQSLHSGSLPSTESSRTLVH